MRKRADFSAQEQREKKNKRQTTEKVDFLMSKSHGKVLIPHMPSVYGTLIEGMGCGQPGAVFEFFDNGLDAKASEIGLVVTTEKGGRISGYQYWDNGSGMNEAQMQVSFTFCGNPEHLPGAVGKYGVGGTIASFYLANEKTVLSKREDGELLCGFAGKSTDYKYATRNATEEEKSLFAGRCGNNGTMILLTDLREVKEYSTYSHFRKYMVKRVGEIYRHRIDEGARFYIEEKKNKTKGTPITAIDPFFGNKPNYVKTSRVENLPFEGGIVKVKLVHLNLDNIPKGHGTKDFKEQGLYFVRSGRQILKGKSLKGLWIVDSQHNAGRVEISWSAELDEHFKPNHVKNKVTLSDELIAELSKVIKPFRRLVGSAYTKKGASTDVQKKLESEHTTFENQLADSAPEIYEKDPAGKTKPREKNGDKKKKEEGSDREKNPPKTKKSNAAKFRLPTFVVEARPDSLYHVIHEVREPDGQPYIAINTTTPYIKEFYLKGSEETKKAMRIQWAAESRVYDDFYDTDGESTIKAIQKKISEVLERIYSVVK